MRKVKLHVNLVIFKLCSWFWRAASCAWIAAFSAVCDFSIFSRAVPTGLLFKWEWNLVKFWVKSHEISQVSSATWRLERMEPSDWLRWVVTWLCSEIWPKGKRHGHFHLHGNDMKIVPNNRGDQELSKTFCGLKIGPLLTLIPPTVTIVLLRCLHRIGTKIRTDSFA